VSGGGIAGATNRYGSNENMQEHIGSVKYGGEYATERKNPQAAGGLFNRGGALGRASMN